MMRILVWHLLLFPRFDLQLMMVQQKVDQIAFVKSFKSKKLNKKVLGNLSL